MKARPYGYRPEDHSQRPGLTGLTGNRAPKKPGSKQRPAPPAAPQAGARGSGKAAAPNSQASEQGRPKRSQNTERPSAAQQRVRRHTPGLSGAGET